MHVRWLRRLSNSDLRALSCWQALAWLPAQWGPRAHLFCPAGLGRVVLLGQHLLLEAVLAGGARGPVGVAQLGGGAAGRRGAPAPGPRGRRHAWLRLLLLLLLLRHGSTAPSYPSDCKSRHDVYVVMSCICTCLFRSAEIHIYYPVMNFAMSFCSFKRSCT